MPNVLRQLPAGNVAPLLRALSMTHECRRRLTSRSRLCHGAGDQATPEPELRDWAEGIRRSHR
jgi:hypothetical protein